MKKKQLIALSLIMALFANENNKNRYFVSPNCDCDLDVSTTLELFGSDKGPGGQCGWLYANTEVAEKEKESLESGDYLEQGTGDSLEALPVQDTLSAGSLAQDKGALTAKDLSASAASVSFLNSKCKDLREGITLCTGLGKGTPCITDGQCNNGKCVGADINMGPNNTLFPLKNEKCN